MGRNTSNWMGPSSGTSVSINSAVTGTEAETTKGPEGVSRTTTARKFRTLPLKTSPEKFFAEGPPAFRKSLSPLPVSIFNPGNSSMAALK